MQTSEHCLVLVILFVFLSACLLTGCQSLVDLLQEGGMDLDQVSQDAHTFALDEVEHWTDFAWQLVTVFVSGLGAGVAALLSKWLIKERKISRAMIEGIEASNPANVKNSICKYAGIHGVQTALHKRVKQLTG